MKQSSDTTPEDTDKVWDLLEHASHRQPSGQFTDNVLRAARNLDAPRPFYLRWSFAAPAMAAAVCLLLVIFSVFNAPSGDSQVVAQAQPAAEALAEIETEVEMEMLVASVDSLDDFSDQELLAFAEM